MGRRYGGARGDCPVTELVSDQIVRLPFYNQMAEAEQSRVICDIEI
jgi:dTDP-4-amino-4,6-dideoxygalactose transaminase